MPRSSEAKLRRRNRKKADQDEAMNMLGDVDWDDNDGDNNNGDVADEPVELFPNVAATNDHKDDLPKQKKTKKKTTGAAAAPAAGVRAPPASSGGGIKTTPLILLILMVGTTVLPALIFAGDYLSKYLGKNNVMGTVGYRLGIGAVPKKRVLSFYEKHAPEKLEEVPKILSNHYGEYPKLIKKLERKYQDYGYFMGWEQDEAPITLAMEQLRSTYDAWIQQYWNQYAPQPLKIAFRNIRYNLTTLYKKGYKIWKKKIWPMLEPIFGVPDGAAAQKRKDTAEARKRKQAGSTQKASGQRRKNRDFRDDVED